MIKELMKYLSERYPTLGGKKHFLIYNKEYDKLEIGLWLPELKSFCFDEIELNDFEKFKKELQELIYHS